MKLENHSKMGKNFLFVIFIIICLSTLQVAAKSLGNFKRYLQITDKEVLIESTEGNFILISAYEDYTLHIKSIIKSDAIKLVSPEKIHMNKNLGGSIYVEELDELVQISTVVNDGIFIQVHKNPLSFSYIDKTTRQVLFEELKGINFSKQSAQMSLSLKPDEELMLMAGNDIHVITTPINLGDSYSNSKIGSFIYPENDVCLISSKGYSIVLKSNELFQIDYLKPNKISIIKQNPTNEFGFLIIYGSLQCEMIEKYALNINKKEQQITLK
ncbi:MAG TPA: hypothetical protein VJY41_15195 [Prolixibacteraceae bacterium]|nr:hypothetical protein [Prolixibacteraceae bacterium]